MGGRKDDDFGAKGECAMNIGIIILTAVNAVFPIILLILLGYVLRRIGFMNDNFVKIGNNLVFKVCLPAMLFINVYNIEGLSALRWEIALYCVAVLVLCFALGGVLAVIMTPIPSRRGVIMQATFRSNFAIIGLPLAAALGGSTAEVNAAMISAFTVPVVSVLAVIALSVFMTDSAGKKPDAKKVLMNIATNPLILGVGAAIVCLCIRAAEVAWFGEVVFSLKGQLKFLYTALNNLREIASPLSLLILGAQFEFSAVKGMMKEIAAGTIFRIVIVPIIGIGLAVLLNHFVPALGWGVNEYPAMVALFGSPVAVSSAVMAKSMGGDEQLAAQLIVWSSIGSMITIFLIVCLMMSVGLLPI